MAGVAQRKLLIDGARLSWMSYSSPETVRKNWSTRHVDSGVAQGPFEVLRRVKECPQFIECKPCDAQCYLAAYEPPEVENIQQKPVLAVCARGTTSIMDWLCDAEANQVPFKDCNQRVIGKVHAGFYRQFVGLYSIFDRQIKQHLQEGGHLLCVGHSLGGACSTIAAVNYASGYPGQVWHASYGSPRVLDKTTADVYNSIVRARIRVKNCSDPVPAVPPPLNYTHVGVSLHLGPEDDFPEIPILLDIGDHDIAKYVAHLQQPEASQETKTPATRSWMQKVLGFKW